MNRKEGWYWVKTHESKEYKPLYFDGREFEFNGYCYIDSFFYSINENRIITPDEPSVLDRAIELIQQRKIKSRTTYRTGEYRIGLTAARDILEKLKSEL